MTGPLPGTLALALLTFVLVALPLLPGLLELRRTRDLAPLTVIAAYDRDIRHFARGFRAYVQAQLAAGPPAADEGEEHRFPDGTSVVLVRDASPAIATERRWAERPIGRVMIVQTPAALPDGLVITGEIYSTEPVELGAGCTLRGLLAERDAALGPGSVVLRWLHGEHDVRVGRGSTLYGRASAEGTLRLAEGCRFERVQAARIEFGSVAIAGPPPPACDPERELEGVAHAELSTSCSLVPGDLELPPETLIRPDLVVRGALRLGERSRAMRSLKARGELRVGPGSRLDAAVVSGDSIHLAEGCRVAGPVIAERDVHLAAGCLVGAPDRPTTISAERVLVEPGAVVHGAIWTRGEGVVR